MAEAGEAVLEALAKRSNEARRFVRLLSKKKKERGKEERGKEEMRKKEAGTSIGDVPFFVFSGGKFEYRKGQDLVARTFSKVAAVVPGAVLVTAWQTTSTRFLPTMALAEEGGRVGGTQEEVGKGQKNGRGFDLRRSLPVTEGKEGMPLVDFTVWLERWYGIDPSKVINLPHMTGGEMAAVLGVVDVAVQLSRAEGGTNLMAMEAMAHGVPVVISNGTGHTDIIMKAGEDATEDTEITIEEQHCYPVNTGPLPPPRRLLNLPSRRSHNISSISDGKVEEVEEVDGIIEMYASASADFSGWVEPSVKAAADAVISVWGSPVTAKVIGQRGADFILGQHRYVRCVDRINATNATGDGPVYTEMR